MILNESWSSLEWGFVLFFNVCALELSSPLLKINNVIAYNHTVSQHRRICACNETYRIRWQYSCTTRDAFKQSALWYLVNVEGWLFLWEAQSSTSRAIGTIHPSSYPEACWSIKVYIAYIVGINAMIFVYFQRG